MFAEFPVDAFPVYGNLWTNAAMSKNTGETKATQFTRPNITSPIMNLEVKAELKVLHSAHFTHDLDWTDAHDTRTRQITGAMHHYVGPRVLVGTGALYLHDPSFHIL